jgi:DNA-binding NarL/FixJ family response regulator
MPELNGLEATRAIRLKHPNIEILVLTMHFSEQVARQILKAGARGYLLKTDSDAQLLAAISSLRQHKPFLTSRVADVALTGYAEGDVAETIKRAAADFPYGPLSRRERQVMQLLAEGYNNEEVAARLGVSPGPWRRIAIM